MWVVEEDVDSLVRSLNEQEISFEGQSILVTGFLRKVCQTGLKPILEAFEALQEKNENARSVLNKSKEQFNDVQLIHASLMDLLEHE